MSVQVRSPLKIDSMCLEVPKTLHFKAAAANGNYIATPVGPQQRVHRRVNARRPASMPRWCAKQLDMPGAQVRSSGSHQVKADRVKSGQVGSSQARSAPVRSGQVTSHNLVRSSQVTPQYHNRHSSQRSHNIDALVHNRSYQVRAGQVRSNQGVCTVRPDTAF